MTNISPSLQYTFFSPEYRKATVALTNRLLHGRGSIGGKALTAAEELHIQQQLQVTRRLTHTTQTPFFASSSFSQQPANVNQQQHHHHLNIPSSSTLLFAAAAGQSSSSSRSSAAINASNFRRHTRF